MTNDTSQGSIIVTVPSIHPQNVIWYCWADFPVGFWDLAAMLGGPCRNIHSHQMNPMLEMSNQWCTGALLIVRYCKLGSPGVNSLVFHYLWSLWHPLPKLLVRKNAKWYIIRFHCCYCSQHTPAKCNLALLRWLSCGVLGSCSNVRGTLQEHPFPSDEPNAGNEQPMVYRNHINCKIL